LAEETAQSLFGTQNVIDLYDYIQTNGWPRVQDLVGKIVIYLPWPEFSNTSYAQTHWSTNGTLHGSSTDTCADYNDVTNSIATGAPLPGKNSEPVPGGNKALRLAQYQADWTFDYGVPPNPIVLDSTALPPWTVTNSIGHNWTCSNDTWKGQVVTNHGTCRFPYTRFADAVDRARGIVPEDPNTNTLRSGYGWTVLLRPGDYPLYNGPVSVNIPLKLQRDPNQAGVAVIGR
jgi:hypothetical protein